MIARSWIANFSCAMLLLAARVVSAQAPQNGPVSPQNSGGPAGVSQAFTFTFTDTATGGASNIDYVALDVGPTLAAGNSCYMYIPRNPPVLNLMKSDPNNVTWTLPQLTPGSGQTDSSAQSGNTNCMISGAGFTVTTTGNTLTVTVPITFFSPYTGTQNIYMIAHDVFGQYSGWTTAGTWTVGPPPPANGPVSPSNSGGPAGVNQPFTFTFTDQAAGGASNIDYIALDVGPALAAGGSCYMYIPRNPPVLNLMNSNAASLQWIVPQITPGSGQTNHNDAQSGNLNCLISGAGFTVTTNGNTLTVTVPITFSSAYTGTQNIYMIAHDVFGQYSGWTQAGTWTVGSATGTVTATSVIPSSGIASAGTARQFTMHYSDPSGYADISSGQMYFAAGCQIEWTAGGALNLLGSPPINRAFGQVPANPLSNATCSIDPMNSSFSRTGDHYDVSIDVMFAFQSNNVTFQTMGAGKNSANTWGATTNLGTWTSTSTPADALQAFTTCAAQHVGGGRTNNCALPGGVYPLTQPIVIGRSGANLQGSTDSGNKTLLIRSQNFTCPMVMVGDTANNGCITPYAPYTLSSPSPVPSSGTTPGTTAYNNISVTNLTFCGGSTLNPSPGSTCYPYEQTETTCGSWTHQITMWHQDKDAYPYSNPNNRPAAEPPFPQCLDLSITNAETGAYSPPWNTAVAGGSLNTTAYAVTIANTDFEDATGHAISIYPNAYPPLLNGGSQKVNGVYINSSAVNSSAVTAILLGATGGKVGSSASIFWGDHTQCDNWPSGVAYADDSTVGVPHNIRIEGSTFANNDTGFMGGLARYVGIRNNMFINNYINPQVGNTVGGTLELDQCSDQVQITGNIFGGPPSLSFQAGALELYSRNLYVNGNTISGYPDEAIGALSVLNATITGNHLYDNARRDQVGDINVATRPPGGDCDAFRDVSGLDVHGNDSNQQLPSNVPYGIYLGDGGEGSTNVIDLLNNNSFSGALRNDSLAYSVSPIFLDQRITVQTNLISPNTTPTASSGPQTISVFPQCSPPLGDPAAGNRRSFRFGANDPVGPSNFNSISCPGGVCSYSSLQGFLSTASNGQDGAGGPYTEAAHLCHFVYFPGYTLPNSSNIGTIYLESASLDGTWAGSSPIGTGGSDLDNTACKIHAATSSVAQGVATNSPHNLVLLLDIEFLYSGKWYMYESVQNNQGNVNFNNKGSYPWSYWGYWPVP